MATYNVLIVGNGASIDADNEGRIKDAIEAFSDGNTWTVTYRQQGVNNGVFTGMDIVIFPNLGVNTGNYTAWDDADVPIIVPGNRISTGTEPMSSSARRGGSYSTATVTAAGAAHEIGVALGWAEDDSVTYQTEGQAFRDGDDLGSGAELLLLAAVSETRFGLAVADTGATMASGTATNRRIALNNADRMETAGTSEILRTVLLWGMDELGSAAQTIAATAFNQGTTVSAPSSTAGAVGRTATPLDQGTTVTSPTSAAGAAARTVTPFDQATSLTTPSGSAGGTNGSPAAFNQTVSFAPPTFDTSVGRTLTPLDQGISLTVPTAELNDGSSEISVASFGQQITLVSPESDSTVDRAQVPHSQGVSFTTPALSVAQIRAIVPLDVPVLLSVPLASTPQGATVSAFDVSIELMPNDHTWIRHELVPTHPFTTKKVSPFSNPGRRRRYSGNR